MDGWEDSQKRSIYGCMVVEVSKFPVVLGLEELTGVCTTADHLVEVANHALVKKCVKPTVMDNQSPPNYYLGKECI